MLKGMSGQQRVVGSDIDLDFLFQAVALQESIHGCDVKVVLVRRRFLRLGSIRIWPSKPILCLYSTNQSQEPPHLIEFPASYLVFSSVS